MRWIVEAGNRCSLREGRVERERDLRSRDREIHGAKREGLGRRARPARQEPFMNRGVMPPSQQEFSFFLHGNSYCWSKECVLVP